MTGTRNVCPLRIPLYMMRANANNEIEMGKTITKQDGMRLNELVAAAIVLSSRRGGFGGVDFRKFMNSFLRELGVIDSDLNWEIPNAAFTRTIPFLSPPNVNWPHWLRNEWNGIANFDNLMWTSNSDRIDFQIGSKLISGECKNYSQGLSTEELEAFTSRMSDETPFHFVVTRTMDGNYFANDSWQQFRMLLKHVAFYRISRGSGAQAIVEMGNSDAAPHKLVLFIEFGHDMWH